MGLFVDMATLTFIDELEKFKEYLKKENNEDAKRPLLYPLFQKLFKEKFKIESDACGADVYAEGQLILESKTDFAQWLIDLSAQMNFALCERRYRNIRVSYAQAGL